MRSLARRRAKLIGKGRAAAARNQIGALAGETLNQPGHLRRQLPRFLARGKQRRTVLRGRVAQVVHSQQGFAKLIEHGQRMVERRRRPARARARAQLIDLREMFLRWPRPAAASRGRVRIARLERDADGQRRACVAQFAREARFSARFAAMFSPASRACEASESALRRRGALAGARNMSLVLSRTGLEQRF